MNKRDLSKIRKLLEKMKIDILSTLEADQSLERQADEVDQSIELATKQFNQTLRARNSLYLEKINLAIYRIDKGANFGVCNECEEPITVQRLLIRPIANLCTPCQELLEFKQSRTTHRESQKPLGAE